MPCSGGPSDEERRLQDKVDNIKAHLSQQTDYLKGCLCAVIRQITFQLPDMSIESFLEIASKNGGVDIVSFWKTHKDEDTKRISGMLDKLSEHERDILRELLDNNH